MRIIRTSCLSALAVLTKLATSLFLNKVLAVYVGATGYGVIGQLQNLISIVTVFASGAVNTGVTKYTAEYNGDFKRERTMWATAGSLGLICTCLPAFFLLLLREPLSRWLLGSSEYSYVLVWLALALPLLVINGLLLAILNGRKAVGTLVSANIGGSLIGAIVTGVLIMLNGLSGALIALAIAQAVACVWTAWIARRALGLRWSFLVGELDIRSVRLLGGFALMSAASALLVPASQMIIREGMLEQLGWEGVGLWQAMLKISETHLLLLTSTLTVYFLPRFSEIKDGAELRREVCKGYIFVIPVVTASTVALYLLRAPLVTTLLSPQFIPIINVLGIQLLGDAFKIISWVMAFTMVSHAQTRTFLATEVIFSALLVGLTLALVPHFGLAGAAVAYTLTYVVYGIAMYGVFARLVAKLQTVPLVSLAAGQIKSSF